MRGRRLTWQRCSGNFPGEGALGGAGSWCRETEAAQVCAGAGLSALSRPAWQRRCGPGLRLTKSSQCILATGAVGEFQSGEGHAQHAQNLLCWVETELGGTGEVRETCRGCHRRSDSWVIVRTLLPPPCFPDSAHFS